jgi:hypothetical protein
MAHLPIPAPRPVLYPLRTTDTARVAVERHPASRRRITIDHQPLGGVTPDMLLDWFTHLGGTMEYGGRVLPRYLVWHPLDHIRWELARPDRHGGVGEGARFRIVEAFGANPDFYVDTTDTVEKLDRTGIRLVRRLAGVPLLQLEHTWSSGRGRTHYVSVLDVGARSAALAPVNRLLVRRVFPDRLLEAWVKHNIEEVGLLEHLLPDVDRPAGHLPGHAQGWPQGSTSPAR